MNAHVFRVGNDTHVILSTRGHISASRPPAHPNGFHFLCGPALPIGAQRIAPHSTPGRSTPLTCGRCLDSFTAFADLVASD
jgi:hypothetical protein